LGLNRLDATADALTLQFVKNPPIDPERIIRLVQTWPGCRLAGPEKLRVTQPMPEVADRVKAIEAMFKELTRREKAPA
jgi:transcription-repair coupling factor (superfamily II helicase)